MAIIGINGIAIASGCTNNRNTTNQTPSDRSEESNPNNSSDTDDNIPSNRSEGSDSDTKTESNQSEKSNSGSDDIPVRSEDTYYYEGDALREGPYKTDFDLHEEDAMIVDNIIEAYEIFKDNRNIDNFVQKVDFSRGYILVVRNGMQSTPKLALESLKRQRETLHVDVSVISEGGGVDDLITNSLLVNVIDTSGTVPETVEVNIDGYV
jgi:hypothetical protein